MKSTVSSEDDASKVQSGAQFLKSPTSFRTADALDVSSERHFPADEPRLEQRDLYETYEWRGLWIWSTTWTTSHALDPVEGKPIAEPVTVRVLVPVA